ncbi:hypothetical protein GCM10011386_31190 [Parapedobacter defluvii]|uniref:Uncharacterized protein n=1 Tax=Parapedobacter defluvii TaxID=2045106 RepID=A0ABQ1M8U3_9SPHI|nr:hypothetical protein GCM10011386_31190 [Parapedobacter defluvii]
MPKTNDAPITIAIIIRHFEFTKKYLFRYERKKYRFNRHNKNCTSPTVGMLKKDNITLSLLIFV